MAIINCPECGKQVSNKAELCPHCGIEIAKLCIEPNETSQINIDKPQISFWKKNKKKIFTLVLPVVILVIFMSFVLSFFSLDSQEKSDVDTLISDINNLPKNLKISDASKIESCSKIYDELSFKQKIKVDNYEKLEEAVEAISDLKIQKAIENINNIGEVTIDKKVKINIAKKYYESLSSKEKKQVSNYSTLESAIKNYNEFVINETIYLINDIGNVTIKNADKIIKAEKSYDGLDESVKDKITNYTVLVNARNDLDDLLIKYVNEKIDSIDNVTIESESLINDIDDKYKLISKNKQSEVLNYQKFIDAKSKFNDIKKAKEEEEKKLTPGESFTSNKWEITYKKTNISSKIYPNNTSGYYMYYHCDDDQVFVDIVMRIKNVDTDELDIENVVNSVKVTYDNTYKYDSYALYYSDGDDIDFVYSWDNIDALDSTTLHIAVKIPREAQSNNKPILVNLNIAGQDKIIEVR